MSTTTTGRVEKAAKEEAEDGTAHRRMALSCDGVRLARTQLNVPALVDVIATVEGAALVLLGAGIAVDAVRVVRSRFAALLRGELRWEPVRGTLTERLIQSAWVLIMTRATKELIARGADVPINELKLSPVQVGTAIGVLDAARMLGELMPQVRRHDVAYAPVATALHEWMMSQLGQEGAYALGMHDGTEADNDGVTCMPRGAPVAHRDVSIQQGAVATK